MQFIDLAKVNIESGAGGNGCLSFRRERNVPLGGPDGGDGGNGGSVIAECVAGLNTLVDFRFKQHFKARRGGGGEGVNRTGAAGDDMIIVVPVGTQILEEDGETLIVDLTAPGEQAVLAEGGRGGHGNAFFKSSTNRAPRRADPGEAGEAWTIVLRLKLLADAGLVGLPNAGKSTFISAVSRARPKIADYPFTTLAPQLGVVAVDGDEFVMADLPGLIEGAHEGIGLGDRFLGHVERCAVLVHLIDGTQESVGEAYRTIRGELLAYGHGISDKPELVCLTKIDALSDEEQIEKADDLAAAAGRAPALISSVTGAGVQDLLRNMRRTVEAVRVPAAEEDLPPEPYDPMTA